MGASTRKSAEEMNEERRAVKARQRANKRAAAKNSTIRSPNEESLFVACRKDRQHRQLKARLAKKNQERLFRLLEQKSVLVLTPPDYDSYTDQDDYEVAARRFEHDVKDIKAAILGKRNYKYLPRPNGQFVVARCKVA